MAARGTFLAAGAAGLVAAGLLAWTALREPPEDAAGAGAGRRPAAAESAASREAEAVIAAVRLGRLSSALAGAVSFLGRFSPGDLEADRLSAFDAARVEAGRWGLSEAQSLAESGDPDGAETVLARALRALSGTAAEAEGAAAAKRVRAVVERLHAAEAARARDEALVPVEKAVGEARAQAATGSPERGLADLLGLLPATTHPDARRRLQSEVESLRRRISARKERSGLRKKVDEAIARGDYEGARRILAGLVEGAAGADAAEAAEAAKDRERLEGLKELEENKEPEALAALRKSLRWLVKQQLPDGSFSLPAKGDDGKAIPDEQRKKVGTRTGLTGLSGLALLGHVRYDMTDEFAPGLEKAVLWTLAAQKPDGSFPGGLYDNSIAALLLVETERLLHRGEVKPAALKAVVWLQNAQNSDGGWRYTPRVPPSDMSVTGWALQVLLHARLGGYEVTAEEEESARAKGQVPRTRIQTSIELAFSYLDRMTDPVTGRTGYSNPGSGSYAMTAAALFCRLRNDLGPGDDRVRLAGEFLLGKLPGAKWGESCYALFYASDAMSRLGGTWWRKWAPGLKKLLLESQVKEGEAAGAWPSANDPWGKRADVGVVFVVALNALSLENFFEHRE